MSFAFTGMLEVTVAAWYALDEPAQRGRRVAEPVGVPLLQQLDLDNGFHPVGQGGWPGTDLQEVQRQLPRHCVAQLALEAGAVYVDDTTCTQSNSKAHCFREARTPAVSIQACTISH